MTTTEILDQFHEYIEFDPGQKKFNLLSANYLFHEAGKKIMMLLDGFDPDGTLSVLYAAKVFDEASQNASFRLSQYLESQDVRDDIERDMEMYRILHSEDVDEAGKRFFKRIDCVITESSGKKLLGNRDYGEEKEQFFKAVFGVIGELKKCRIELFAKGGAIGKIKKFHTQIIVFETMAECLIAIENAPDAIYLVYINQNGTADGYFAFVFKSNGTILAIDDRIPESYIGQHGNSRNGRWSEAHADSIFPYDYIFKYTEHDYKGYAAKYSIEDKDGRVDFLSLQPEACYPLIVTMVLLASKYEGYVPEDEPLLLNSFMKQNYIAVSSDENKLAVIESSALAAPSREYSIRLEDEKIITGAYAKQYDDDCHFTNKNNLWAELWGAGFHYDPSEALLAYDPARILADKKDTGRKTEFITSRKGMDLEVYREARKQLADYITRRMQEALREFAAEQRRSGSAEKKYWMSEERSAVEDYWKKKVKENRERFVLACMETVYRREHPETKKKKEPVKTSVFDGHVNVRDVPDCISISESETPSRYYTLNEADSNGRFRGLSDGRACRWFFSFSPYNWREMEALIGQELPKIFQGWAHGGRLYYGGNSILQATDAVDFIESPLYTFRAIFSIDIGFSEQELKKQYIKFCEEKGTPTHIFDKPKAKKPVFVPSSAYAGTSYEEKCRRIHEEAFGICPEIVIKNASQKGKAFSLRAEVPVKGNKDAISLLVVNGWHRGTKFQIIFKKDTDAILPTREKREWRLDLWKDIE